MARIFWYGMRYGAMCTIRGNDKQSSLGDMSILHTSLSRAEKSVYPLDREYSNFRACIRCEYSKRGWFSGSRTAVARK